MTTYTNIHDLPASIVRAVQNDPYTGGGDISATRLIDAPQIAALTRTHHAALTVDVSERIWALLGQAVHTIMERAGLREEGVVVEERLFAEIEGWTISGQFDRMQRDAQKISDYKVTTVYKKNGSDSWTRQLNILRWLAAQHGDVIETLEVVAIFRDWRKSDALRDPSYPRAAIGVIPVPVWPLDETEAYIRERVALHQAARGGMTIPCTPEERWYSGSTFALVKPGQKRAFRTASTREGLPVLAGYDVVERPGVYKRCLQYCDVSAFCAQWAACPTNPANAADAVSAEPTPTEDDA